MPSSNFGLAMNDALDRSLPSPDSVSSVPESASADGETSGDKSSDEGRSQEEAAQDPAGEAPDLSHLPEAYREPMRRLHRRVQQARETIEKLRAENEQLRAQIQKLNERPVVPDDKTVLALDDEPEALRGRIDDFIDAIDAYLEATAMEEHEEEDDDSSPAE